MKLITQFAFLMCATACAVCTAQTPATSPAPAVPPRTLPSHPEEQSVTPKPAGPVKKQLGDYAGYQRIVVNGQERYCRNDKATGSRTERTGVCLTASQVQAEQLRVQEFIWQTARTAATMPQAPMNIGGALR
jgi:hypothetical protein